MQRNSHIYPYSTGRPVTMGTRQMVATPHYLASLAGHALFERGGSAVDAAIAANAALAVVYGHMSGLGGDLFAQVWSPETGKVEALNASGRAGERVDIDFYRSRGLDSIPSRGPLSAITVPGAVDGWWQLHQRFGKVGWDELFQPALRLVEGFPLSAKYHDFLVSYGSMLRGFADTAAVLLPGGRPPAAGALLRQPDLARSLRQVADGGADVFYRGELARRIVSGLQGAGGLLTEADFAAHVSDWVEPLRSTYRGYEVTQLPPNTQGIATLMILNMLEQYDLAPLGRDSADYYHLMTEIVKLAFADRDRWVTDPSTLEIPYDHLLSKEYAQQQVKRIDLSLARGEEEQQSQGGGDTVYLCAAEASGLTVSLI
jgi:gamma-glutamyltranspeptidase